MNVSAIYGVCVALMHILREKSSDQIDVTKAEE
jgi:hypothetical protein